MVTELIIFCFSITVKKKLVSTPAFGLFIDVNPQTPVSFPHHLSPLNHV